jgi:hypothetical protein
MATISEIPTKSEITELTVTVVKIAHDLSVFRLPDGTVDFLVEGSDAYVVQFKDRKAFGVAFAILRKGHNLFPTQIKDEIRASIAEESVLVKLFFGEGVESTPIVIPPRPGPPKFPAENLKNAARRR